jgi:uncharacterized damage-inducible protein DinB
MTDDDRRQEPPTHGPEHAQLRAWLDYHRDTLRWKCRGLTAEQLAQPLPPSTLTLGGLMAHLALVEDNWLSVVLMGREGHEHWRDADWEDDPDWEMSDAARHSPEELLALYDRVIARCDAVLDEVGDDLDRRSVRNSREHGTPFDLRWILVHLVEEYARHNGHADLIRESIDGTTGE